MTPLSPQLCALNSLAQKFAPQGAVVAVTDPTRSAPAVWPQEAPAMARAVPARRREFAAGRHGARAAMRLLQVPPQAVPVGHDRAPQWPAGLVGSICHDARSCVTVLAPQARFRGLGIDVEPEAGLPEDMWQAICVPSELNALRAKPAAQRAILARHIFCAKEALYKAQYPLTRRVFGFDAIAVTLTAAGTAFTGQFLRDIGPVAAGTTVSGQCGTAGAHIFALVALGAQHGMENANFPVCATG